MTHVVLLRHARRNAIKCVNDAMYIGITWRGKRESKALGRIVARAFNEAEISVVPSLMKRCRQTATMFKKGYGKGAEILSPDPTGKLTYLLPRMIEMHSNGFSLKEIVAKMNGDGSMEIVPKIFEGGYNEAIDRWLSGKFKDFITPDDIYAGMMKAVELSNKKSLLMFVSDIQISIISSIVGITEFNARRVEYLEGICTPDHAGGKWHVFAPGEERPAMV